MVELALVLMLIAGQSEESATVRDLKRLEQQLATTWQNRDCDGWGAILATDWSVIHITGAIITKAQAVEMCRAPRPAAGTISMDEISVRTFDDAAVVTGRTTMITGGAKSDTVRLRFTDVFIRRGGHWQVVASHATRLAPE
jgi:Domain of unknown function (DUF4440)